MTEQTAIAFFDFDGTITASDSFLAFIFFSQSTVTLFFGGLALSPHIFGYGLGLIDNERAKAATMKHFFTGWEESRMVDTASRFYAEKLPSLIRPGALERIKWHREQKHKLVLVTASINYWVQEFAQSQGMDVLATGMEVKEGHLTGNLSTRNCWGPEKEARIRSAYDLKTFSRIYAYGDTRGDQEMLALAHEAHFRPNWLGFSR